MGIQTQKKDLRYLNKDFQQYRDKLIDFSKTYFPDIFNDFNESSPAMIFIEMASYVGDVLSYYIDNQLRESLIMEAQDKTNGCINGRVRCIYIVTSTRHRSNCRSGL